MLSIRLQDMPSESNKSFCIEVEIKTSIQTLIFIDHKMDKMILIL